MVNRQTNNQRKPNQNNLKNTSQNVRRKPETIGKKPEKRSADNRRINDEQSLKSKMQQNRSGAVRNGAAGTQNKRKSRGTEILGRKPQKQKRSAPLSNTRPDSHSPVPQNNSDVLKRKSPDKSAGTGGTGKNVNSRSINKKNVKAAKKAMNTKYAGPSRKKFRGGNYVLYYLLFAVVAVVVVVILSNTVLFNCKEIIVEGADRYTADEIIASSKIRKGNNLLHIDKAAAEDKIVTELAYVDKAKVTTSFPTKVVITVEEAQGWFCVSQNGVNMLISRGGKILEKGAYTDVPIVMGYNAKSLKTGAMLESDAESKQDVPQTILNTAEKIGLENIDCIDVTDRYAIAMEVDGRITLELGTISNIESKIIVAKKLIENEISPSENVTILLTNPEKVAVHTNNIPDTVVDVDNSSQTGDLQDDNSAVSTASD